MAQNKPTKLLDAIAVSGTTAYVSPIVTQKRGIRTGFHAVWTGSMAGTIAVYRSMVEDPGVDPAVNWALIPDAELPTAAEEPAGSNKSGFLPIVDAALHLLFVYTNATGSGTMSLYTRTV